MPISIEEFVNAQFTECLTIGWEYVPPIPTPNDPEQIANLNRRDRLMSPSLRNAEVVHRAAQGVLIRWWSGTEKHYDFSDPILKNLTNHGSPIPGEPPWIKGQTVRITRKRPKGRGAGVEAAADSKRNIGAFLRETSGHGESSM